MSCSQANGPSGAGQLAALEALLLKEQRFLWEGDYAALDGLLFEKHRLLSTLPGLQLDPVLLRRCHRLNRDILDVLGPQARSTTYSPPKPSARANW